MIALDLECRAGHRFEGWFDNIEDFERQKAQRFISCPICGSSEIERLYSTFAIKHGRDERTSPGEDTEKHPIGQIIQSFYNHLIKDYEDVGGDFAKEALKIHYGVSEKKNIRGTTTSDEEDTLKKEGVAYMKIPMPRYDA